MICSFREFISFFKARVQIWSCLVCYDRDEHKWRRFTSTSIDYELCITITSDRPLSLATACVHVNVNHWTIVDNLTTPFSLLFDFSSRCCPVVEDERSSQQSEFKFFNKLLLLLFDLRLRINWSFAKRQPVGFALIERFMISRSFSLIAVQHLLRLLSLN